MQQEDKAMVMTLYMTVVKQHSQHIMTPTITIYMIVVKQLTLTTRQSSYHYIQSIAELKYANILYAKLKYANILYAFHEFTVQKL
jgi:hypothetical protein